MGAWSTGGSGRRHLWMKAIPVGHFASMPCRADGRLVLAYQSARGCNDSWSPRPNEHGGYRACKLIPAGFVAVQPFAVRCRLCSRPSEWQPKAA